MLVIEKWCAGGAMVWLINGTKKWEKKFTFFWQTGMLLQGLDSAGVETWGKVFSPFHM